MKCTNHPEREADGMCAYCGKPFCKDCLVEVKGRMYCKGDLGNVLDEAKQQSAAAVAGAGPTINISNSNESTNTNTNNNTTATSTLGLPPRKSKMVAMILCILGFFGLAGLHRMYVGKVGSGFFHLFTVGVCFIGTIMDLISILSGGFRDSYGQPLA